MSASVSLAPEGASLKGAAVSYYSWTINDKDVAVRLNLDVVDRLGDNVLRKFTELDKRGSEVGGILLGSFTLEDGKRTFVVEDYELAFCDYSCSALFSLSDECKGRMVDQLLHLKTSSQHSVVGFFRSHTRKDLGLDENDLSLIRDYFPGPNSVFLLIKPFARKPSTAGFFIWEHDQIRAESSYLQFPFRRSELVIRSPENIISPHSEFVPAGVRPVPVDNPPGLLADSEVKQSTTAILSQSDSLDSLPLAKEQPPHLEAQNWAEEAESEPMEVPRWDSEPLSPPHSGDETEPEPDWIKLPKLDRNPIPPAGSTGDLEEEGADPLSPYALKSGLFWNDGDHQTSHADGYRTVRSAPQQLFENQPTGDSDPEASDGSSEVESDPNALFFRAAESSTPMTARGQFRRGWVLLLAGFVLVLGTGYLGYQTIRPTKEAVRAAHSLGLSVDRSGHFLVLRWNRNSSLIATAQHATVLVTDGHYTKKIELSADQLQSGSFSYSPISSEVSLEMEVADAKRGRSIIEQVRTSGGREALSHGYSHRTRPIRTVHNSSSPDEQADGSQQLRSEVLTAARSTVSPEPKNLVRVGQAKAGSAAESLVGSQAASSSSALLPGTYPVPGRDFGAESLPKSAERGSNQTFQPPDPEQNNGNPVPLQSGKRIIPAKLIRSTPPEYPEAARAAHVAGVVRVQALVGTDGSVKDVVVASGPPLLRSAAVEAVRRFVYEPAMRDGKAVEFLTRVDFNFLGTR